MNNLVIYHDNCTDGFGAAYVAYLALPGNVKFLAANYGDEPPTENLLDVTVYVLDFSYPMETMVQLANRCKKLVWIDHHKTALEAAENFEYPLPKNFRFFTDLQRSGCGLAWDYFFDDRIRPNWVNWIEDRDLWQFNYPSTKQFNAGLSSHPRDMATWSRVIARPDDLIADGAAILRAHENTVQQIAKNATNISICAQEGLVANCSGQFASDVGHALASKSGTFGATWYQDEAGRIKFSLRSTDAGPDVSELARYYGGGGHRNAAGFVLPDVNALGWVRDTRTLVL